MGKSVFNRNTPCQEMSTTDLTKDALGEITNRPDLQLCLKHSGNTVSKIFDFLELLKKNGEEAAKEIVDKRFTGKLFSKLGPLCGNVSEIGQEMRRCTDFSDELNASRSRRQAGGKRIGYFAFSPFMEDERLILYATGLHCHELIKLWLEREEFTLSNSEAPYRVRVIGHLSNENCVLLSGKVPQSEKFGRGGRSAEGKNIEIPAVMAT